MELNKVNPKFTGQEMIEKLQDENKYLRENIVEEKIKSEGNIRALNKALIEVKEDNSNLSRQIEDYIELKDHYSNLKHVHLSVPRSAAFYNSTLTRAHLNMLRSAAFHY